MGETANQAVQQADMFTSLVGNAAVAWVLKIIAAIAVIILMIIVARIIAGIVKRSFIRHSDMEGEHVVKIANLIRDVVYYIFVAFAFFVGFEILGFDVGLILGGVSFGVGLAFKEVLGNMIAGIMILYTKEFRLGDVVEVQASETFFGRIEEITIRYTIIRTLDLRQVVLPNMTLISVPIKTFSAEEIVRLNTIVSIHYNSDITKAVEVVGNAINALQFVVDKPNTKVFVQNFADSAIELKCIFSFDPKSGIIGDFAVGYVNEAINAALKENGIIIPYTQTTITFEQDQERKKIMDQLNGKPGTINNE